MNERLYISAAPAAIEPIAELSRVVLLVSVETVEGERVPAGASGTVLAVYSAGEAYCVEFTTPFQAEIVVNNIDLEAISGEDREHIVAASNRATF